MLRVVRTLVFASLGVLALVPPADAAIGRGRDAALSFFAKGPGGLKIEGKTSDFSVSEQAGKIRFVVPLARLDTGIELRNKHMREKYLEVAKYPNAELVVERSALRIPADGQAAEGSVPGTMTIHGQSKPVSVAYKARRRGPTFDISGNVHLNIKDYGIAVPSYLGVTVKPDVEIALSAKVDD